MILAERAARLEAEAVAARAQAVNAGTEALITHYRLEIEKLRRQLYGTRSEKKARLLEQMELQLEELEAAATEDELAAEQAAARKQTVQSFQRKRPSRKSFPAHLPRERVVIASPDNCPCCGSTKLSKLGEDITETLEVIPRQWKVIQTVREKFSCRDCETITQPPAPFHVTPRGFAGPNLLAMILFEKFGQHQPLNRQSERYRREGIDLSLSTLADQVGACTTALLPLYALIERHVLAAERLHGDDTTVPILAKGKTIKGHIWTYVRDDRPFGGRAPPAALYYASRDRRHEHPGRHLQGFTGILQADAYSGYNEVYDPSRAQGPITAALCRVDEDVAIPIPHRPGCADFPLPVLHGRASLAIVYRWTIRAAGRGWRLRSAVNRFQWRAPRAPAATAISARSSRLDRRTSLFVESCRLCRSRHSGPAPSRSDGRAGQGRIDAGCPDTRP